jgi:hypothetical protein
MPNRPNGDIQCRGEIGTAFEIVNLLRQTTNKWLFHVRVFNTTQSRDPLIWTVVVQLLVSVR